MCCYTLGAKSLGTPMRVQIKLFSFIFTPTTSKATTPPIPPPLPPTPITTTTPTITTATIPATTTSATTTLLKFIVNNANNRIFNSIHLRKKTQKKRIKDKVSPAILSNIFSDSKKKKKKKKKCHIQNKQTKIWTL